jgi:hypothetical protein
MKATEADLRAIEQLAELLGEVVFGPARGYAIGQVRLRDPKSVADRKKAAALLNQLGIDARIDAKLDYVLLPQSVHRDIDEYAAENSIARSDALILLVRSGLYAVRMAEQVTAFRQDAIEKAQAAIAEALVPIRQRQKHDVSKRPPQ